MAEGPIAAMAKLGDAIEFVSAARPTKSPRTSIHWRFWMTCPTVANRSGLAYAIRSRLRSYLNRPVVSSNPVISFRQVGLMSGTGDKRRSTAYEMPRPEVPCPGCHGPEGGRRSYSSSQLPPSTTLFLTDTVQGGLNRWQKRRARWSFKRETLWVLTAENAMPRLDTPYPFG